MRLPRGLELTAINPRDRAEIKRALAAFASERNGGVIRLLQCMSPLLAQSGGPGLSALAPLLGADINPALIYEYALRSSSEPAVADGV